MRWKSTEHFQSSSVLLYLFFISQPSDVSFSIQGSYSTVTKTFLKVHVTMAIFRTTSTTYVHLVQHFLLSLLELV